MEVFTNTNWTSATELHELLLKHMKGDQGDKPVEIERKWIVKETILNELRTVGNPRTTRVSSIWSIWLSTEPEIRLRVFYTPRHILERCMLCFKDIPFNNGLVRTEIQTECTFDVYKKGLELLTGIATPYNGFIPIPIKMWIFSDNMYRYEVKSVDFGTEYQLEIECKSVETANAIQLRPEIAKHVITEVTSDDYYKMAQYWKRTRLQ